MKLSISIVLIMFSLATFSQVAINQDQSEPESSAMLDVKSTEMGILIPRMNSQQMRLIEKPATGLLVFNTSVNGFYYYDGENWAKILNTSNQGKIESINIKSSLNLNPTTPPQRPKEGDIYMDKKSHKLRCWDGKTWKDLF